MVMIAAALAAAVLYGAGAAVEQRQAAAAPVSSAGRPRLLFLLARQPLWLLGITVQIGGFAAHAVALRSGPLATVQMLVSAELIVAVVIVRIWSGRPLGRACWAAALTVVAAVATFLELTSPGHGHAAGHPGYAAAAGLGAAATGAGALAAAVAGLRAAGRRRAVFLAVAAGLADSCSAVVTMAFSHVASHGLPALAASWTLYVLAASGAGNVLLTQTAYQAGQPMTTLPVIAAVTPVASAAVGIGLLGETPRTGLAGGVAAGLAVLIASLALAFLARSAPHSEPRNHRPAGRQHSGPADCPWQPRPGNAPFPTGRRPPRPGLPPAWQVSHAPARRRLQIIPSRHGSNDCPDAGPLSRTAAVPVTAANGRNAMCPLFRSMNVLIAD
jgi:drug/metabolite transporter (DMT)-like permease